MDLEREIFNLQIAYYITVRCTFAIYRNYCATSVAVLCTLSPFTLNFEL